MNGNSEGTSRASFWERQLANPATRGQLVFDALFGVLLPMLCVYFDPVVFRSPAGGVTIFGRDALFGYFAFGFGWVALAVWLGVGRPAGLLAGFLGGGALFALLVGLLLLPLTLIALVVLIGIVGFVPFVAAFVFLRNAFRAYNKSKFCGGRPRIAAIFGLSISLGAPLVLQAYANREIDEVVMQILSSDSAESELGVARFKRLGSIASADRLVWKYLSEKDSLRRDRLRAAFLEIAGKDLDQHLAIIRD